ncbi:MAG: response regulator, partial [Polaromonas sp.]
MLKHILEEEQYQVSTANNGRAALEIATRVRPALVISDVNMPEMSGYELCRRIKASPGLGATPVILVTSLSGPDDVLLGLECGADCFVIKPYEKQHLLERVRYALGTGIATPAEEVTPVEILFRGRTHQITASRTQILGLLMSTYEATAQRNRELHESREQLRLRTTEALAANRFLDLIIENIPDTIFIKDASHLKYVRLNAAAESLLGISRDQLIGKNDHDFFPKEESDFFMAKDREVLAGSGSLEISEEPIHTSHNGVRLVHTKKVAVLDDKGAPTHLLGISEDVTEQKELERKIITLSTTLQARAEELEAANQSLESFTSAATHDLRSPLSVIGGYAGLLEKNYASQLDEKGRRYVSVIGASVQNMAKLIDDLLAFSKSGLYQLSKTSVDAQALAEQVLADILQLHPEDKKPVVQLGPLPPTRADAAMLRQVWVNLLSNAVKYSSRAASPQIEVSGRINDGETVYSVLDNGAGFD